jgi:hypothetical protein
MVKKGKGDQGKTINERAIYPYVPSLEMARKWKQLSEKAGITISKFVVEHVENSLRQEDQKDGYIPRLQLLEELRRLREENKDLLKRTRLLDTVVDRYEKELQTYRMKSFADEEFRGRRKYESQLVEEFKKHKEIRKESLLNVVNADPSDKVTVKALRVTIENLERYGMIKDLGGKWRWLL